jgi:hypothetical protein
MQHSAKATALARITRGKVKAMEWFFIEALFALAAGIAIVWWTMAPLKKPPRAAKPAPAPTPKAEP